MTEQEEILFELMNELLISNNEEEFIFFINNHQELLKVDPILFIGNHISLYANREDIVGALNVVNFYKNAPYISMEVEDFLNELYEKLLSLNNPKNRTYDKDKIEKLLLSKNENSIASALSYLSKQNARMYLDVIEKFLLSETLYKYKTLALFILVEQKVDSIIKIMKKGNIFTYNPSKLSLPFDDIDYLNCKEKINEIEQRDDLKSIAIELLNTLQIKEYPDSYIEKDNIIFMSELMIDIARTYLNESSRAHDISLKYQLSEEEIKAKEQEIGSIIAY